MPALILHCVADKVRLQLVTSKNTYLEEYQKVYGGDADGFFKEYVNCENWYPRILSDLNFKNFKKFKLISLGKQGLWSISGADIVQEVHSEIHNFILMKIMSYNEDENEPSFLDNMLKSEWEQDAVTLTRLNNEAFVYALKFASGDVAQHDQGLYVPSYKQWQQLIFELMPYRKIDKSHMDLILASPAWSNLTEKEKEEHLAMCLPKNDLEVTQCEYTQNMCLNGDTIYVTDINTLFDALFGEAHVEKSLRKIETSQEYIKYLNSTICSEGFVSHCSMSYAWVDDKKEPGSFLDMIDACACLAPTPRHKPIETVTDAKNATRHWIYKSGVNDTQLVSLSEPLHELVEFDLVKDVCMEGEIGKCLLNHLHQFVGPLNKTHLKDLATFMEIIRKLDLDCDCSIQRECGEADNKDTQFLHTKVYAETFKDDDMETVASAVIEKVHGYLKQVLKSGNVNMNRIGMDLVELGVKKTRKARGYVYGIKDPIKADIAKLLPKPLQIVSP